MQQAGVPMLYDSASNQRLPCLYICPVANVLGHTPLIPCFIGGNSHPTIPHSFKDDWVLRSASTDTQRDRGNGSRIYEVKKIWMLRYCRGSPLMVSITKAEMIRGERIRESRTRAGETRGGGSARIKTEIWASSSDQFHCFINCYKPLYTL
jgi:hypothetical protein